MTTANTSPISVSFSNDASAFDAADALICDKIAAVHVVEGRSILVGLSGPQGSGKTTTAARLRDGLAARRISCVVLSLDDFYLTRAERARLAATVHPLLATRGVPGTHDVPLMTATLRKLATELEGEVTPLPFFDKAHDDRAPQADWPVAHGRPDVVILEGWCVGAVPESPHALTTPINSLEADEDPDGVWRRHVNDRLGADYAAFFASFDLMVALIAPSFECVFAWRSQQEDALRQRAPDSPGVMSPEQVKHFIAHYERTTRHMIAAPRADLWIDIAADRRPIRAQWIPHPRRH